MTKLLLVNHDSGTHAYEVETDQEIKECLSLSMAGKSDPIEIRFWSKVDKYDGPFIIDTQCWVWIGSRDDLGYGQIWLNRKIAKAHRLSLTLADRPLDEKDMVCHRCDNPSCVRPGHLFTGTLKDNSRDMVLKGRHLAVLTDEQVIEIKGSLGRRERVVDIARKMGIRDHLIHRIKQGKTYKHVG